ncbi:hypothetical protein AAB992_13975 [Burkholderia contaminans]|uniref:hypothetical protein n=1 Tax=Burkholderia contaminans TaxID=488447 RepID=UPI002416AB9C|nr:hypothetical protein [Burkholderia contaminans]WFN14419.1 hypothetical protein LXE92_36540 [Burkholderia contaminans]
MRKTLTYTVTANGRDKGKVFQLTEMPADAAEKWAIRALLAIGRAGIDLPPGIENEGIAAIARVGLEALMRIDFHDAEPLLDEMIGCVQLQPNPTDPRIVRALTPDDIEEVSTRVALRREVFRLHTGF